MSFVGAPVTKVLIFGLAATSLTIAIFSLQSSFEFDLHSVTIKRDLQYYSSIALERSFGSFKFISFLISTFGLIVGLELLTLIFSPLLKITKLTTGPFSLIAAIVYQNYRITPTTFYWKVFGYELSNRVTFYFLAFQLFASQPPTTLYLSFLGIIASYLYRSNFLSLLSFRLQISSPTLVHLSTRFFNTLGITGDNSDNLPRRSTMASFDDTSSASSRQFGGGMMSSALVRAALGPEVPTPAATVVPSTGTTTATTATTSGGVANPRGVTTTGGLVREWTEGITGGGGQVTSQQITELSTIFPDLSRDVILSALEREPDVGRAATTLLSTPS